MSICSQNRKIFVLSPNREQFPCPVFPMGALELFSILVESQKDAIFFDFCFAENWKESFSQKLLSFNPAMIFISIRNIDNEVASQPKFYLDELKEIVDICRAGSSAKIVVGGAGYNINPQEVLSYLKADYGLASLSKTALLSLIDLVENKQKDCSRLKKIGGLSFFSQQTVCSNDSSVDWSWNLNKNWPLIFSNIDPRYFSFSKTEPHPAVAGLKTKYGCVCQCIHCSIPNIEGPCIQTAPIDEVGATLDLLVNRFAMKRIFFCDNVFNYPYEHALQICQEISKRKLKFRWSCYLHPKWIDEQLIFSMKQAGCENVCIGTDTAAPVLLKKWRKGFGQNDLKKCAFLCHKMELPVFYSLMIGGLGDSPEFLTESLLFLKELNARFIWAALGVRIYPKTSLASSLINLGVLKENESLLKPRFYISPPVELEALKIIREFKQKNPEILLKLNSGIAV